MKIKMIENPDRKWWNPHTWAKVSEITLEKDYLLCLGNMDISSDYFVANEGAVISVGVGKSYYTRKKALEQVKKFLFPPRVYHKRTLTAIVSAGTWSYVVNDKGNGFSITLEGYGSCTPSDALQNWIDKLPKKKWNELYKDCDKRKEKII